MINRWRAVRVAILAGAVLVLLDATHNSRLRAKTSDDSTPDVDTSIATFTKVYALIQQNYADPVDPNLAIYGPSAGNTLNTLGAIPGMLRTLDPHSNFFDPDHFARLREDMEGKYFGVGMRIQGHVGKGGRLETMVVLPIPNSPAFRAGLRPGDVINSIDGRNALGLDTDQVAKMLKGPKGTVVHLEVTREGASHSLAFNLIRDRILSPSVDDAFMIRPGIAYIHIRTFDETTNEELSADLRTLGQQQFQGLILDLRDNLGGLLNEAVGVSDHFLQKNQLIVYHHGRSSREKRYFATHGERGSFYPIVVLINRNTASAAEIVTGALQDHDRALVMGEPSFGKGLVQSEFPLSEQTMLLLTTARYYTPSGRLIQRDYSKVSLYDYYNRLDTTPPPHTDVRMTDGGREVYGGGGITPDVSVAAPQPSSVAQLLLEQDMFFRYGQRYLAQHNSVSRDFVPDAAVLSDFEQFVNSHGLKLTEADINQNRDFIQRRIRLQLIRVIYGDTVADQDRKISDPLVLKALNELGPARELVAQARHYMAIRSSGH